MLRRLLLLLLSAIVGCGSVAGTGSSRPRKLRIAVVPKGTTHEFWKTVHFGAERAAREWSEKLGLPIEIIWKGPINEGNREDQINLVKDLTVMGVDGICLAPISQSALVKPVQMAKKRGVPVVIFDSGLADKESIVSYVATDNREGGRRGAETLAAALMEKRARERQADPGKAQPPEGVILLRYAIGSESTHEREEGFLEAIHKYHPDIEVLESTQYSGTTRESAHKVCKRLLLAHADRVDGVFAVCEPNGVGMHLALEDAKLSDKVRFVSFDASERLIEAMPDKVQGIVLQDPDNMGYLAVTTMLRHLQGEAVKAYEDTGVYVARPDNLADAKIHDLLHPPQAE